MCLIVASPQGKPVPITAVWEAWDANPHGFGVVYATKNRLVTRKTKKLSKVYGLLREAEGKPYVAHWRYATHGVKSLENTHPFEVSKSLAVAHNGIIKIDCPEPDKSDTWHYVQKLKTMPDVLADDRLKLIGEEIGTGNKLAFLHSSGQIKIVNEAQGDWEQGLWYSNTYSVSDTVFRHLWKTSKNEPYQAETNSDLEWWDSCELCSHTDWIADYWGFEVCKDCANTYGDQLEKEFWDKEDTCEPYYKLANWSNVK